MGSRVSEQADGAGDDRLAARKPLTAAARRALAEAQARRESSAPTPAEPETGGRGGLDPARFGDWEVKGIASDF